jgi:hypothetical protein
MEIELMRKWQTVCFIILHSSTSNMADPTAKANPRRALRKYCKTTAFISFPIVCVSTGTTGLYSVVP